MRQQYHSRPTAEGNDVWDVRKLAKLSKDLPVRNIPLSEIKELDEEYWYTQNGSEKPTCRNVTEHISLILDADLEQPIILSADGRVMDGMHRACKALIEGHKTIKAVKFQITPEPDFKNISLDDLPHETKPSFIRITKKRKPSLKDKGSLLKMLASFVIMFSSLVVIANLNLIIPKQDSNQTSNGKDSAYIKGKTENSDTSLVTQSLNLFSNKPVEVTDLDPMLSEDRAKHILHGTEKSGGHLYGTGKPCKSEFPSSWDENKILQTIKEVAANDNLPWEQQKNGYYVADSRKDGVRLRVVLSEDKTRIITGYPTNMPRNPCIAPANDNIKPEPAPKEPE